jgi:hypothetical protein
MLELFPADEAPAEPPAPAAAVVPPIAEEPTEVVNLKRECSLNGERFAPGRHVVPASKAVALRSIEAGR